jgi:hypothetical protein
VSRSTFAPRDNNYVLFALVDRPTVRIEPLWLVPSTWLDARNPGKDKITFEARTEPTGKKFVDQYLVKLTELPTKLLSLLDELDAPN